MKRKITIKQKAKSMEYQKENVKQVRFSLNKKYDQDIIDRLAGVDNINGYLKNLIRKDIENGK